MSVKYYGNSCGGATRLALVLLVAATAVVIPGCSQKSDVSSKEEALDAEVSLEERPYFDAGRPFAEAIAANEYARAYEYLSTHAKARMSPNQFVSPADDASAIRNDAASSLNPTPDQFAQMMSATETEYGKPAKLSELTVYSTDPAVLGGKGKSAEDKLDAMFAIGMMPDSVPASIRKASLRCRLGVKFSPEQLAAAAKAFQMTPEALKADPDFDPYITLKLVLVEESDALKVGYFEFLPPGILD